MFLPKLFLVLVVLPTVLSPSLSLDPGCSLEVQLHHAYCWSGHSPITDHYGHSFTINLIRALLIQQLPITEHPLYAGQAPVIHNISLIPHNTTEEG